MSALPIINTKLMPEASIDNMQKILGTSCSQKSILMKYLRCNQLHWSINSYIRDQFANYNEINDILWYSKDVINTNNDLTMCIKRYDKDRFFNINKVPYDIFYRILTFLDFKALITLGLTSKYYYDIIFISSNINMKPIWYSLLIHYQYIKRINNVILGNDQKDLIMIGGSKLSSSNDLLHTLHMLSIHNLTSYYCILNNNNFNLNYNDPYNMLKQCYLVEKYRYCIDCCHIKQYDYNEKYMIVPIVYGYPSTYLMQLEKQKKLVFGGDYMLPGASSWLCLYCKKEYYAYPYWCTIISVMH